MLNGNVNGQLLWRPLWGEGRNGKNPEGRECHAKDTPDCLMDYLL